MNIFKRLVNKIPLHKKDVWYNISNNISKELYPIIFDKDKNYIDCEMGLKVVMGKTKDGKLIYYKVVKIRRTKGSDWLYPSDAINCDLKFSHIQD